MIKRVLLLLVLVVTVVGAGVAVNTLRTTSRQVNVAAAPAITVDTQGVANRLGMAIRLRTVSNPEDSLANADQFEQLHAGLLSYPRVHATLTREIVGGLSLLYRWAGTDTTLPPILLMAHQDVVPIAPGTEKDWATDPFAGVVKDGFVWGRGAWDDKGNLIAQLEAIETLIAEGITPRQRVYLAYGADEETLGERGAVRIAALLKSRNVKFDFVIDEGLLITEGIMPGLKVGGALVGVAEKGYMSVKLEARSTPGHSSMPLPKGNNAIAILSEVLTRLEQEQMPARIQGVSQEMFETLAPELGGFNRVALSNLWLLGPVVRSQLEQAPGTNANIRTTTALTIVQAGNKENVIPGVAEAIVNFRLLPGDTPDSVMHHVKRQIGDLPVTATAMPAISLASPVSSTQTAGYKLISQSVRSLLPDVVVAPGLMIGATDARHFVDISSSVYRFSPVRATSEDLTRFHGTNERISVANLVDLVRFYHELVRNAGQVSN